MVDGNGKAGLSYVLQDMSDAQANMDRAKLRLRNSTLPNFKECPAGGEEFHASMADMSNAQTAGIQALLKWQTIHVKREMAKSEPPDDPHPDQPEFKTKYFSARGVAAMWPVGLLAIAVIVYVVVQVKTGGAR